MSRSLFFCLLLLTLWGIPGCRSFRQAFDRPERVNRPVKKMDSPAPERRPDETGDKLFDSVFHRGGNRRQQPDSAELTDRERALVGESINGSYRMEEREFQRIREKNKQERERRRRKVYGTGENIFF